MKKSSHMDEDFEIREQLIESEEIFTGRVFRLFVDRVRLPDGRETTREVVHHRGAVGIVPITAGGDVLLVRQWRHAVEQALLEIPAGVLGPQESPEACARRELAEEVGCGCYQLQLLTTLFTAPGYVRERIHIFLACDLYPQESVGDEDERLQIVSLPFEEAVARCLNGEIRDGKTVAALLLAREFLRHQAR